MSMLTVRSETVQFLPVNRRPNFSTREFFFPLLRVFLIPEFLVSAEEWHMVTNEALGAITIMDKTTVKHKVAVALLSGAGFAAIGRNRPPAPPSSQICGRGRTPYLIRMRFLTS